MSSEAVTFLLNNATIDNSIVENALNLITYFSDFKKVYIECTNESIKELIFNKMIEKFDIYNKLIEIGDSKVINYIVNNPNFSDNIKKSDISGLLRLYEYCDISSEDNIMKIILERSDFQKIFKKCLENIKNEDKLIKIVEILLEKVSIEYDKKTEDDSILRTMIVYTSSIKVFDLFYQKYGHQLFEMKSYEDHTLFRHISVMKYDCLYFHILNIIISDELLNKYIIHMMNISSSIGENADNIIKIANIIFELDGVESYLIKFVENIGKKLIIKIIMHLNDQNKKNKDAINKINSFLEKS